jgi:hypothetical protein
MPLQLVAFWGLFVAFTAAYSIKVLVSEFQSIDMHCIVLSLKFYGRLSISVLGNKQPFKKTWRSKVHIFKKLTDLWTVALTQNPRFPQKIQDTGNLTSGRMMI